MCIDTRAAMGWWTPDPLAIGLVATTTAFYTATALRKVHRWEAACFYLGELTLLAALVSPLDRLSDLLFSAHMTQHELIMVVAPPLIVLGRPVAALGRVAPALARLVARPVSPAVTMAIHALVIWTWHIPSVFEAALRSDGVHAVQHAMFFGSAALFWWSIVRAGRVGYGLAALFVVATAMHTSILGALLTVAQHVWYPGNTAASCDARDDQTMAGLVMWIPAGSILTLVALGLFAVWLGEASRRVRRAERIRMGSRADGANP